MRKFFSLILILVILKSVAQNQQILYNFAEIPQTLLLNPALETNYQYNIGVPLLSGVSANIGVTNFALSDVFANDGININDKITETLSNLSIQDFAKINTQIEVLNGGFRLNDKLYLSFGFYEEVDAIGYFPKDIVTLITEGNSAYLNKSFSASQINYKVDVTGVLHFGITKKINERLSFGSRFKIYSSALNVESKKNSGTFTTVQGTNNLYTHYFNNINIEARSSGIVEEETNEYIEDYGSYLGNTLLGPNLGLGLDLGVAYKITPQLEFSGSIVDFGFIKHKTNVKNTKVEGNFSYEGIDFLFDSGNSTNYWDIINNRFQRDLPTTENQESYISWRPTKIYSALKYSFGERRSRICYDDRYKDFYTDAFGVQLFGVLRPLGPQMALTAFYEKAITKQIHTKFTYTVDDFSLSNVGAGLSIKMGKLNMYTLVDNILSYRNLSSANHVSLQLGFNLIFN